PPLPSASPLRTHPLPPPSPFTLASSPARRFLHRPTTDLPPSGKNLAPAHTRLRTRLSKWPAQRVNFERERGELPGGAVEQKLGAPSLMTVELGADFRVAHCAPIS